ncbi:FDXHR family putative zinc-binding protein [Rhodococcus triatomae]|nr:hypothetical protein G419_16945 [Rhodococcus triatomae BKS 15-14]
MTGNPPIRCNGCDATWTALGACHCTGCHETFTGLTAFEKHRRDGHCHDPASVGLVPANRGWTGWGWPGHPDRTYPDDATGPHASRSEP